MARDSTSSRRGARKERGATASSSALSPAKTTQPEIPLARLDADALSVVHRLRSFGHQAYLVGGCVRDLLLDRQPKDFDVATSAHPGEIRAVFRNCRLIGRRFRLAHVYFRGGKIVETATFRTNPNGESGGKDLLITHDNAFGTAEEDAKRRDFTVNGLFYDVVLGKVLDYVGGKADLERRVLRTIGDPDVRIQEDPVRLLRAVRFAAKLDFEIHPTLWEALVRYKTELARCAPARVLEEVFRLLRSGHARTCLDLLLRLEALDILLPPLAKHLRGASPEAREAFFASLGRLDEVIRAGYLPDDAALLATLLTTLAVEEERRRSEERRRAAEGDEEPGEEEEAEESAEAESAQEEEAAQDEEAEADEAAPVPWAVSASAATVEEFLRELSRSARLPRRISERARSLLQAFRTLRGRRRRRGSPTRILRQNHFPDALLILWLWSEGTGEGKDRVELWLGRAREAGLTLPWREAEEAPEPPEAPAKAEASEPTTEAEASAPDARREAGAATPRPGRRGRGAAREERLPPEGERGPPPGPADFLPF